MANIDAPESSHGRGRAGQPFSNASGDFLRRQVVNDPNITMVCIDRDTRYGRGYLNDKEQVAIQSEARRRRAGLWRGALERDAGGVPDAHGGCAYGRILGSMDDVQTAASLAQQRDDLVRERDLPVDFKAIAMTPLCWQPMPASESPQKLRRHASQVYAAAARARKAVVPLPSGPSPQT